MCAAHVCACVHVACVCVCVIRMHVYVYATSNYCYVKPKTPLLITRKGVCNRPEEVGHAVIGKPRHVLVTVLEHIPQCIPECHLLTEKL